MSKILLLGGSGLLGQDLLTTLGTEVIAPTSAEVDVRDRQQVDSILDGDDIDIVVNAAGYTRVDDAETDALTAEAVNADGPANLARACAARGARLVHLSTDYVFDGAGTTPYPEDHPKAPVSAYGRSKARGEDAILRLHPADSYIVRTAWLYGAGGANFASTVLGLAERLDTIGVVDDQIGQPTWSRDLAEQIGQLLNSDARPGIYHGTNSGMASWYEFARSLFAEKGLDPNRITRATTADFPRPAPRPAYSVLGHDNWIRAGLPPMRPWGEALHAAIVAGAL